MQKRQGRDVDKDQGDALKVRETERRPENVMERRTESGMKRRPESAMQRQPETVMERRPESTMRRWPEKTMERRQELSMQGRELSQRQQVSDVHAARAAKAEIVEGMVDKSNPLHESKRNDNSRDLHFQDENDYDRELQRRIPRIGEEAKQVVGYYDHRDDQAFVRDQGNTLETAVHEKLHQKSRSEMPTRFNEGVTEHFTRQTAGEVGRLKKIDNRGREIPRPVSDYEREREIVGKISATIGDAPLHSAYFDGKTNELRQHMDSDFGRGAYQELTDALEERDYKRADAVLKSKGRSNGFY